MANEVNYNDPAFWAVVEEMKKTDPTNIRRERAKATERDLRESVLGNFEFAKKLIPQGGRADVIAKEDKISNTLGRVEKGKFSEELSTDIKDIIAKRRAALSGMSAQEKQVLTDKAKQDIDRQSETQMRRLQSAQASMGMRGATALSQQADILKSALKTRAEFSRDLYLENEKLKRQALNSFETSVTSAERGIYERKAANIQIDRFNLDQELKERQLATASLKRRQEEQRFNLQQVANERFAQLSTALGLSQITSAELSAGLMANLQSQLK